MMLLSRNRQVIACWGLSESQSLFDAVDRIVNKYPSAILACFDQESYDATEGVTKINVIKLLYREQEIITHYNVIGALVGSDYQGNTFGLKEMRL